MMLHQDPITGEMRIVAPGRAARMGVRPAGCPFCPGNEQHTPEQTGCIEDGSGQWVARAFPNLFPLTEQHEVLVPTRRHATSWRQLSLPELEAGLALLVQRWRALQHPARYVHAFVNDGAAAGASLEHVHAQLVSVPADQHAASLMHGVQGATCALCALVGRDRSALVVESDERYAILAHPLPRIAGALLVTPVQHDHEVDEHAATELATRVHRALVALPADCAFNMWLVADAAAPMHWYLELQPRTAHLAGVELALGLHVVARDPELAAKEARARLHAPVGDR